MGRGGPTALATLSVLPEEGIEVERRDQPGLKGRFMKMQKGLSAEKHIPMVLADRM